MLPEDRDPARRHGGAHLLLSAQRHPREEGWSAQFLFEGSDLVSFSIYLRQYTLTDASQQALPVRQAAAAAAAAGVPLETVLEAARRAFEKR